MPAVLLQNLIPSQITEMIPDNYYIFCIDFIGPNFNNSPVFSIADLYNYDGDLWIFNLDHLYAIDNLFKKNKIKLFLHNIDWLYKKFDFEKTVQLLHKVDHLYVKRGHEQIVENYCNRKPEWIYKI